MQIEIDFEVFKALTAKRESETDTYNSVIRRLLKLSETNGLAVFQNSPNPLGVMGGLNALTSRASVAPNAFASSGRNALLDSLGGVWFGNTHFPDGTQFRATYKGKTYLAEIRNGQWIGSDGVVRTSPSEAAGAISQTNVNGWRFWFVRRPDDHDWHRMDMLKS